MGEVTFEERANARVAEMLRPENHAALEELRLHGSTNKVYRIPLGDDPSEFVVVKVLPAETLLMHRRMRRRVRNLLYGEHDPPAGKRRAVMEVHRYREWRDAGLRIPQLIETPLPEVRIIRGLPFPTFWTVLNDDDIPLERKLAVLRAVVRSLAHQHRTAVAHENKGLVHRDPGPWNIMFDLDGWETYWFDLEQPETYPRMTIEDLMVRGLRIFTMGVLDHLSAHLDAVVGALIDEYEPREVLWRLGKDMAHPTLPLRIVRGLGLRKERFALQRRVATRLLRSLEQPANVSPGY